MDAEEEVVQADLCIGRIGQGLYPVLQCLYNHSARKRKSCGLAGFANNSWPHLGHGTVLIPTIFIYYE